MYGDCPMNSPERDEMQLYLKRWLGAGELLRHERLQRLRRMSDTQVQGEFAVLGGLWRSGCRDLCGDGIVQVQRVFRLHRERATGS